MKTFSILLMAVALVHGAPALAGPSEASPLIGHWAVDVSRLPMPPEARPKSVTIAFSDAGSDRWAIQIDVVDADGKSSRAEGINALDGTPTPVQGNLEADIAAAKMPGPGVLVMQLAKGGVPGSTRVYAVAADGKSMVETAAYFESGGRPVLRTNYFTRIP